MIKLYTMGSTRGMRVFWLCKELELDIEVVNVDLKAGEHKSESFQMINPCGKVPAIDDNGFVLFESVAICNYIAEKYPEKNLIPKSGTFKRALYDQWTFFVTNELESALWAREKNIWYYPKEKRSTVALEMATNEFSDNARILEKYMSDKSFIVNDQFSVADITAGYVLKWAQSRSLLDDLPALEQYIEDLTSRTAFPHELYKSQR